MKKFTLIELLVVVAIIGILSSIMLPSLQKARNKGKDTACISNTKQMGIGIFGYSTDSNDKFPMHRIGNKSWYDIIEIGSEDLMKCPRVSQWDFSGSTVDVDVSTEYGRTHTACYGYNGFWLGLDPHPVGTGGNPMTRNYTYMSDAASPSNLIVVTDSSPLYNGTPYWSSSIWYPARKTIGNLNEGVKAVHGSNGDRSSILYADGHVSTEISYYVNFDDTNWKDKWNPNPANWPIGY